MGFGPVGGRQRWGEDILQLAQVKSTEVV
jgi:hypothetical protein